MPNDSKAKRDSKCLNFVPVARPGKNLDHEDMEKLARETAFKFKSNCRSLRQLKPGRRDHSKLLPLARSRFGNAVRMPQFQRLLLQAVRAHRAGGLRDAQ